MGDDIGLLLLEVDGGFVFGLEAVEDTRHIGCFYQSDDGYDVR